MGDSLYSSTPMTPNKPSVETEKAEDALLDMLCEILAVCNEHGAAERLRRNGLPDAARQLLGEPPRIREDADLSEVVTRMSLIEDVAPKPGQPVRKFSRRFSDIGSPGIKDGRQWLTGLRSGQHPNPNAPDTSTATKTRSGTEGDAG